MQFRSLPRLQKACFVLPAIYALVFLGLLIVRPGRPEEFPELFSPLHLPPHLFGGLCCIVYAWRGHHPTRLQRLAWLLMGLTCISNLMGYSLYFYYECTNRVPIPVPSWCDPFWLAIFPFMMGGMLLLFGAMPNAGRARLLLDSAIATSSVGVLIWYFLLQHLWHRSGASIPAKLVSIAYPLGDIACLFSALVLLSAKASNRVMRWALSMLACGVIFWVFSDTIYAYTNMHRHYVVGSWSDWGWPFGALLFAYASMYSWASREKIQEIDISIDAQAVGARSLLRLFAPYAAAGISLSAVLFLDYRDGNGISNSMFFIGLGMLLLVIMRQVFTLLENRHLTGQLKEHLEQNQALTEELSALNEELTTLNVHLEQRVDQRTKQIGALLELTQAVNNTLDINDVLAATLEHTLQACQAQAVIVWLAGEAAQADASITLPYHKGLDDQPRIVKFLARQAVSDQVHLLPIPADMQAAEQQGICLCAPLLCQHHMLGMIGIIRWNAPIEPTEWGLLQSIGLEVGTALENARQHHAALEAADRDPVTHLYNHRALHQRLSRAIETAQTQNQPMAVIMLDLNNFKCFNDTYGHLAGDDVLRKVAHTLLQECDKRDIVGRYGGDEFLIVLPGATTADALALAQRLQERMLANGFRQPGDERTIPITLRCGVAAFPEDSANQHELLTIADHNLSEAKRCDSGVGVTTEEHRANLALRAEGSFALLEAMVVSVDNKDRYTRRHSEDVTEYALWIAEELGVSEDTMRTIRISGLLHDVGKIGVPDEILRKPGRLTPEEFEVMKRHPRLGALIVGAIPGMEGIVDGVRSHHERWDGNGYPDGTEGEETPFLGRLLAVADAFSAMTTDRPYRQGMDWDTAVQEIVANIGTQFDPTMAQAFLRAIKKRRPAAAIRPPQEPVALPKAA
jgi:diguanylate cyclase (GGDEF)-like protein